MIKLFQIENENPLFDLWPLSNPKRASYYVETETIQDLNVAFEFLDKRSFEK